MKKPLLFGILLTVCVVIVAIVFAQVYPVGMISYWTFDEGEGTTAFDSVDANNGIISGATWATGIVGDALSFDGNDQVVVPNSDSLNFTEAITVALWVKPNGWTGDYEYVAEKGTWAGNAAWFFFIHHGFHAANFCFVSQGGSQRSCPMLDEVPDGVWSQIVGTYDRQNSKIYFNGVLNNHRAWTEPIRLNSHNVYIGSGGGWLYFKGEVDEVAIYNRALTACEIYQHYINGLAGKGYTLEDSIETLIISVGGLDLPKGIEKSLTSQLDNALDSLKKGKDKATKNKLKAFIHTVEALRGKKLTDVQADALIIAVQCIIDNI